MKKYIKWSLIILLILLTNSCTVIDPMPIPELNSCDRSPAWSHDGNWIAYNYFSGEGPENDGLYVVDTNGQNKRLILSGIALNPSWAPDNNKLTFSSGDIFTINFNGDSLNRILDFGNAFFPCWSPNGNLIIFDITSNGSWGLWLKSLNNNKVKHLELGRDASWAPNNQEFVYVGSFGDTDSENQLWIADTSGLNVRQLTHNNSIINRHPSWSPDGNKIAWTTDNGVEIIETDGSNSQLLIEEASSPSWSPDSKKITFTQYKESEEKILIYTINIDGTGLKQITH